MKRLVCLLAVLAVFFGAAAVWAEEAPSAPFQYEQDPREKDGTPAADIVLNLAIFLVTPLLLFLFRQKVKKTQPEKFRECFRYFTCLSNLLCSLSALAMAAALLLGGAPEWVWLLKYAGTAAVTVTMLTVFLFLAPSVGKDWYGVLLKKPSDLFMHLLTPVAALVSFCVFERRGMAFGQCLWGLLPVALYGPVYLYRIRYAPEGKRWPDFYGFDRNGKWPVMFTAMMAGTFLLCLGLMALQNA